MFMYKNEKKKIQQNKNYEIKNNKRISLLRNNRKTSKEKMNLLYQTERHERMLPQIFYNTFHENNSKVNLYVHVQNKLRKIDTK